MFDTAFDLVISLGDNCACATYLRDLHMRERSFPFDWITGPSLERRVELLENEFYGFCKKENLREFVDPARAEISRHRYYEDVNTDYKFLHDFLKDTPFELAYPAVYEKYNRRIKRLYAMTSEAKAVLFVWFSLSTSHSDEAFKEVHTRLVRKFGSKISLLVIEHKADSKEVSEAKLNESLIRINADFSGGKDHVLGNDLLARSIFLRIKKRKNYSYTVHHFLVCAICSLIPFRTLRRELKHRLDSLW